MSKDKIESIKTSAFVFMLSLGAGVVPPLFHEENVLKWVIINCSVTLIVMILKNIFVLFTNYDRGFNFELDVFFMCLLLSFYFLSRFFEFLYPTALFWILLTLIIILFVFLTLNSRKITKIVMEHPDGKLMTGMRYFLWVLLINIFLAVPIMYFFNSIFPMDVIWVLTGLLCLLMSPYVLGRYDYEKRAREKELNANLIEDEIE